MASSQVSEHMFREAFRFNSVAALEAVMGNGAGASSLFQHALEVISQINLGVDTPGSNAVPVSRNVSTIRLAFSKDESFCIYDKLLTFERSMGSSGEVDLTFYSSAIIFNMGLLFHQRGSAISSPKFYRAANRMYEKALNIIANVPTFFDSDLDALHLAVLNNRAHINLQIGSVQDAESDLKQIRQLSSAMLFTESFMPHLEESMISEILINSMVSAPACAACA